MLQVNLPIVNKIHPKSEKFVTGEKIKTTGESKFYYSPVCTGSIKNLC